MPRNAGNAWAYGAKQIERLMRKDTIELLESVPVRNAIGEVSDSLVSLGTYKANVTTPQESIGEESQGNVRTHLYQITLAPEVFIPMESKIFVRLVETRQGVPGATAEVTSLVGGLLGWTLDAADEKN